MVNDYGRNLANWLFFLSLSFTHLFILLLFFFTLARMPSRSADWKIGCLLNWRHHRKLGRLQIANLRPEQNFFSLKGLLFFFFSSSPSSNGNPSPDGLQLSLFLQPSLISGSHSAMLITSHQKGDYKEGQTPQRAPLYQNLPCQLGSSFPEPSCDYQCTDGIKITSYSYMNHK